MNKEIKTLLAFLAGAAAGAAVVYLITQNDDEGLKGTFKDLTSRMKSTIADQLKDLEAKKAQYQQAQEQEDMMGI